MRPGSESGCESAHRTRPLAGRANRDERPRRRLQEQMTETSTETTELRQRFLEAQLAGDRRKALELISAAAPSERFSPAVLRAHVIRPAQAEIGRLWETNAISIAQEHMATAISHLALAALFERDAPRPPNGCKVILASVEGELHEFPARLV